ncbi:MAG: DUF2892 domain-containing protein [Candidatus Izemoplasmataceae bacterium]
MKNNVGKFDQTVRYIIAIILVIIAVVIEAAWAWLLLIPAVILALTAAIGWCGLYKLFGINTCKFDSKEK